LTAVLWFSMRSDVGGRVGRGTEWLRERLDSMGPEEDWKCHAFIVDGAILFADSARTRSYSDNCIHWRGCRDVESVAKWFRM
jgi:hypothetical protein